MQAASDVNRTNGTRWGLQDALTWAMTGPPKPQSDGRALPRYQLGYIFCLMPALEPVHPGVILRERFLEPLGLTSNQVAGNHGKYDICRTRRESARRNKAPAISVRNLEACGCSR